MVCPSTLRRNWEKEIRKMTNLEPRVLDGTPKKRDAIIDAFRNGDGDVLIINYEILHKHVGDLRDLEWIAKP